MKKLLLSLALLAVASYGQAFASMENCRMNLLDDYKGDSKSYQIADESLVNDFDSSPRSYSIESVQNLSNSLVKKSGLNCQVEVSKASCKRIIANVDSSMVCYLESEIGYFLVSKDQLSGVNIVFNRWD